MLLTALIGKTVTVDQTPRGYCVGVAVLPKNGRIKYLLCSTAENGQTQFAVPYACLVAVRDTTLLFSALRAVLPKPCAVLRPNLPVYTVQGSGVGDLENAEFSSGFLTHITVKQRSIPFDSISAIGDAILLRTKSRFPIGQPIPAPYVEVYGLPTRTVSKRILKQAVRSQTLIRLTLALPPFNAL